jgi:hypothetical protein
MKSITAEKQGRVFAADELVVQGMSAISALIAGPLAEKIFEPWLSSQNNSPVFSTLLGTDPGAGIAILYMLTSLGLILVGIGGFCLPQLRRIETPKAEY